MSNIVNDVVEEYMRAILPPNNALLKDMENFAMYHHVPIIQPEVAKFLEVIIRISKPKNVLEVGAAIGYSAITICNAMQEGNLITIEKRLDMIEQARHYIHAAGLNDRIEILQGNAEEILPTLKKKFDFIFLDAAKGQYMQFFSSSIGLLKKGGILVSDNVLYKGMVASNAYVVRRKKTIVKRMRVYMDYIMNHPDLVTSIIPIGDGVALSYKK